MKENRIWFWSRDPDNEIHLIDRLPWFLRRLGARGFLMLVCAYIWFWLGLGNWRDVLLPHDGVPHLQIEHHVRAIMWWIGPVAAVITAGLGRRSWIGLLVLTWMPSFVIFSFSISWLWWYLDGGHTGYDDAWYQAGIYLALPALVLAAALIPAPPTRLVRVIEDLDIEDLS